MLIYIIIVYVHVLYFRMQTAGFAFEDYSMVETCAFWGAADCHDPNLKQLAFALTPLSCSSGEAERNWKEVSQNLTKKRNRLNKARLAKMVFVRRFIQLKRSACLSSSKNSNSGFSEWVREMLNEVVREDADDSPHATDDDNDESENVFQNHFEPGEQGRVNGKEPGQPPVSLTSLKRDNAAKSWLFEKYYGMHFVDKNPEEDAGAEPLDESEWEHRVIQNISWWRNEGFSVETALRAQDVPQSIEKYRINACLHQMIRDSPYNTRPIVSQSNIEDDGDNDNVVVSMSE